MWIFVCFTLQMKLAAKLQLPVDLEYFYNTSVFTIFYQTKAQGPASFNTLRIRAATILRLLGNETMQFNTRGKKSEPGLRKQLNIDAKSTTKFNFFFKYMNICIYFTNIRRFRFSILYFKYLQTLVLCVTTFHKVAFYYNVFRRRLKSRNIKMVKVSYILNYKCVFSPKFNKLSTFFPVVWLVTIL